MENWQTYNGDWVDRHFDNEGGENNNRPFDFIHTSNKRINYGDVDILRRWIKDVIRQCSKQEKEFTRGVFKKLKILVINEYCFNSIDKMVSKKNEKYQYFIFLSQDCLREDEALVKHKFAHELTHFWLELKGEKLEKNDEERKCNKKATDWGFPDPIA